MFTNISFKWFWKVLGWGAVALLINLLMVLSLQTTLLSPDYGGMAFAQTGPPDDTPTPIPTATSRPGEVGDIIIDVDINVPAGDGGGGSDGGGRDDRTRDDGQEDLKPTPTFTPLPVTTVVIPPRFVTETIFVIGVTPVLTFTPTVVVETTPIPLPDYSACELVSISGTPAPGLPGLAGPGAVYQIPPAPGESYLQVTTKLGMGVCNCTLTVPTSPDLCKIAEIDQDPGLVLEPPAPLPANIKMLVPFNIDIYGVSQSQSMVELTSHSPPLVFTTDPLQVSDEDNVVLLRYDEIAQQYMLPQQEYNPATKVLRAYISDTSFFVLGILTEEPLDQATATSEPVPPVGLETPAPTLSPFPQEPSTLPETGDDVSPLLLFLAILAGLIGLIAIFLLLGGGRALMAMLPGAPPPAMVERSNTGSGLALAFGLQMPDIDPLIRVTLASLPPAISAQPPLSQTPPTTSLNLSSVEVGASISAVRPGLMRVHQAVVMPDEIDLVSWNEFGLHPRKLSYTVLAGRLDWYSSADEAFVHLHDLEAGEVIEIQGQPNIHYRYIVDEVQSYQADTTSVMEIPPATTGMQLVLIAWGEGYDVEEQEYRDYIVIQAHLADTSLENRLEMSKAEMLTGKPPDDVE